MSEIKVEPKTAQSSVAVISLSYDECAADLFATGLKSDLKEIADDKKIFEDNLWTPLAENSEKLILMVGSERQDIASNKFLEMTNKNGDCFTNYAKLSEEISEKTAKECEFDPMLLADTYHKKKPGTAMESEVTDQVVMPKDYSKKIKKNESYKFVESLFSDSPGYKFTSDEEKMNFLKCHENFLKLENIKNFKNKTPVEEKRFTLKKEKTFADIAFKIEIILAQINHIRTKNPGKNIEFHFVDPKLEILLGVQAYLLTHPQQNVTVHLHHGHKSASQPFSLKEIAKVESPLVLQTEISTAPASTTPSWPTTPMPQEPPSFITASSFFQSSQNTDIKAQREQPDKKYSATADGISDEKYTRAIVELEEIGKIYSSFTTDNEDIKEFINYVNTDILSYFKESIKFAQPDGNILLILHDLNKLLEKSYKNLRNKTLEFSETHQLAIERLEKLAKNIREEEKNQKKYEKQTDKVEKIINKFFSVFSKNPNEKIQEIGEKYKKQLQDLKDDDPINQIAAFYRQLPEILKAIKSPDIPPEDSRGLRAVVKFTIQHLEDSYGMRNEQQINKDQQYLLNLFTPLDNENYPDPVRKYARDILKDLKNAEDQIAELSLLYEQNSVADIKDTQGAPSALSMLRNRLYAHLLECENLGTLELRNPALQNAVYDALVKLAEIKPRMIVGLLGDDLSKLREEEIETGEPEALYLASGHWLSRKAIIGAANAGRHLKENLWTRLPFLKREEYQIIDIEQSNGCPPRAAGVHRGPEFDALDQAAIERLQREDAVNARRLQQLFIMIEEWRQANRIRPRNPEPVVARQVSTESKLSWDQRLVVGTVETFLPLAVLAGTGYGLYKFQEKFLPDDANKELFEYIGIVAAMVAICFLGIVAAQSAYGIGDWLDKRYIENNEAEARTRDLDQQVLGL